VIEVLPVAEFNIPRKVQTPVVVVPLVPIAIELAVDELPMVLDEMVKTPAAPEVTIPSKV
jgi:hypothetical protein